MAVDESGQDLAAGDVHDLTVGVDVGAERDDGVVLDHHIGAGLSVGGDHHTTSENRSGAHDRLSLSTVPRSTSSNSTPTVPLGSNAAPTELFRASGTTAR